MESRIFSFKDIAAQYDDAAQAYEQSEPGYQQDFDSLFQFISKNKNLKERLTDEYYHRHIGQINQLNDAIKAGDHADSVFNDKDCSIFLLHLIKRNDVTFDQGMTVYAYIMAKSQFSKDISTRSICVNDPEGSNAIECDVIKLGSDQEIYKVGGEFIEFYSKIFPNLDAKALKAFILTLPASERWVISLKYQADKARDRDSKSADRLAHVLSATTDGFFPSSGSGADEHYTCYIPSVSVMQYLLKTLFPNHMRIQFSFGSVSETTLQKMHKENFHPVPLHSPYVKSNMLSAHHYQCGPFIVWMHDMMHTLWASYLSYQERQVALNDFPAVFDRFENVFNRLGLDKREIIVFLKGQICDFDLSGNGGKKFKDYIAKAIFNHFDKSYLSLLGNSSPMVIGGSYSDQFYLAAICILNECKLSDIEDFILNTILNNVFPELDESQGKTNQHLIDMILNNQASVNDFVLDEDSQARIRDVNWQAWKKMLVNYSDNSALWRAIIQNPIRYQEYVNLSLHAGLKFIYPYVPLSADSLNNLKTFVDERVRAQARERLKRPLQAGLPDFFEPAPKKIKVKKSDNRPRQPGGSF